MAAVTEDAQALRSDSPGSRSLVGEPIEPGRAHLHLGDGALLTVTVSRQNDAVEERDEELLQRFARDFSVDRRGRVRVRNPARPYVLVGLAVGVTCTGGIALTDRGGFMTTGILQLVLALCAALSVVLLLVSFAWRGRGRRTAGVLLGLAFGALIALFVIGVAARLLELDIT